MSDYFDRIERQLVKKVQAGLPHRSRFPGRLDHLAAAASLLVVIAVGAVFIGIRGPNSPGSPSVGSRAIRIVFSASALDPRAPLSRSMDRSVDVLSHRLRAAFRGAQVSRAGSDLAVVVPQAPGVSRGRILALAVPARLEFYDWEAKALTPAGQTVASRLQTQDPVALALSQGSGATSPGGSGAGSLPLYQAVRLAAKQSSLHPVGGAGMGAEYYLFGKPESQACRIAAAAQHEVAPAGVHCLLAGPSISAQALDSSLPAGVSAPRGQRLTVAPGLVVLHAQDAPATSPAPVSSPAAQFYVLRNEPALSGADVTHPTQSTDAGGAPDVTFGFRPAAAARFQQLTAQIARRGAVLSGTGQTLSQHFAVSLDNKLITVPSIDFKTYPDGITSRDGVDLTGGLTIQSARTLATLLRFGPLSVNLVPR